MAPTNTANKLSCKLSMKEKREQILAKRVAKTKAKAPKGMIELAKESKKKQSNRTQMTLTDGFKTIKVKKELIEENGGKVYNQSKEESNEANGKTKEVKRKDWMDIEMEEDEEEIEFLGVQPAAEENKEDVIISTTDEEMEISEEEDMEDMSEDEVGCETPLKNGKRKADKGSKGETSSPIRKTNKSPNKANTNISLPPNLKKTAVVGTVTPDKKQVTMTTYATTTKVNKKEPKENLVRLRFRYFAPKDNNKGKAPIAELVHALVETARQADKESMIMPWEDTTDDLGPLNLQDFTYANKVSIGDMKKYLDLPFDVKTQGFTPGRMEYQLGVRFTTTMETRTFKNAWDLQKRDRIAANKKFIAVELAEHQESPRAYLIGVAAGSTESMEFKSINEGLSKATGITGIAVNYQTFHQVGITKSMWDIAYKKADKASTDKKSRAYNKTKYAWAPQGLCVYVTDKSLEKSARLKMIELYGECKDDGTLPVWPGGSTMRFIPLKSTFIKNNKTRNKVEKRIKFHIYQKVEEVEIPTNFTNIYESDKKFGGKTFQEIIMEIESKEVQGLKLFRHFNHVWDRDPERRKWAISTHTKLHVEAIEKIKGLKMELEEKYGNGINRFFEEERKRKDFYADRGKSIEEEEEDDWFKDSEIISDKEKCIFVEGITEAMFETTMKGGDEPSWGSVISNISPTGESKASTSTLTRSTITVTDAQVEQRKKDLVQTLTSKGVKQDTIEKMVQGETPYDLVSGVFKTDEYTHEGMVTLLCNLQMAIASLPQGQDEDIGQQEDEGKEEEGQWTQVAGGAKKDP